MRKWIFLTTLFFSFLEGKENSLAVYSFSGRLTKEPIYRVAAPADWTFIPRDANQNIHDTTQPIAEFLIRDGDSTARIAIHNFPVESPKQRIPPIAQIERWKKQFASLDSSTIKPQAFSGFAGLLFEGSGVLKGQDALMIGFSLQLGDVHRRMVALLPDSLDKLADVTIKAVLPKMLHHKRNEVVAFGRSFEFIDDIPK